MLRDKSLIPLSHQHQKALALCVRIDRGQPIADEDLPVWQGEIEQLFEQEIKIHFAAEEDVIFPAARRFAELVPLVEELVVEHAALRELFCEAETRRMSAKSLPAFARTLSIHIRKEERQLFERIQELTNAEELGILGIQLEAALQNASPACALTNETTKLKAKR